MYIHSIYTVYILERRGRKYMVEARSFYIDNGDNNNNNNNNNKKTITIITISMRIYVFLYLHIFYFDICSWCKF